MRRVLAMAAAVAWTAVGAAAGAAETVGFVAVANGDVSLQQGGAWQAAARDAEVAVGDGIRTGTGASAKIVLVDDTLLQIDEETELRIETWHVGDAATKEVSIVRQARGRLRATVGDAFGGSTKLEVHIPTAAIGIKGTDFEVVDGTFWDVCLLSGGIRVTNSYGTALPAPGQCVYAYPDRAPGDEHPNPRVPLEVGEGGKGERPVATTDFAEPLQIDVAAPPVVEGQVQEPIEGVVVDPEIEGVVVDPNIEGVVVDPEIEGVVLDPPTGVVDPYDSTTGDASEDELENFEIDPGIQDDGGIFIP